MITSHPHIVRKFFVCLLFLVLLSFTPAVFAGPVVIDGTDAGEHGFASGGVNFDGWLYMQKVLESLASQVAPGTTKVVVDIGTEPGSTARDAIDSAFALSSLPAAGWTIIHVNGAANVATWLAVLSTGNTGILALPTSDQTTGDMDASEQAALNAAATQISNFVGQGGGLHAMAEEEVGGFGWLTTLIPGITFTSGQVSTPIVLTPAGLAAFPGLTNADTAGATPWHGYFGGSFGGLQVLAVADRGGVNQPIVLGGGSGTSFDDNNITISDQKAGSMLVFPYYTNAGQTDTRISITNVGGATVGNARLHIMLLDKSCQQLDYYACISPNGTLTDKASSFDPLGAGYIIVLVVDPATGLPTPAANIIIGSAFVKDGDFVDSYGAEAFWGPTDILAAVPSEGSKNATVDLRLKVPCEFAIEIQSPKDAVQKIITVGLQGDVNKMTVSGSAQNGTGFAFNAQERGGSFQKLLTGGCFSEALITDTNPRVPTTLAGVIATGNSGHLRFNVNAAVGLILTSNKSKSGWSGIRTLHKTKSTIVTLTVPVFMPTC